VIVRIEHPIPKFYGHTALLIVSRLQPRLSGSYRLLP
jgi:hypothetical protein